MADMTTPRKRGLGKGLVDLGINALLSDSAKTVSSNKDGLRQLAIEIIQPGRYQPRRDFNPDSLKELADSIRSQGIIQPLIVRPIQQNRYEIIAGERRWRAAQLASLQTVPVIIREMNDETAIAAALIENIQRENLNPVEEAQALQRLIDEFKMTHDELATAVGKARATISNLLRILQLNSDVKLLLEQKQIELGHAKLLLALTGPSQTAVAHHIVTHKLSVRATEQYLQQQQRPSTQPTPKTQDPNILKLERNLTEKLGAKVTITHRADGKGQINITYHDLEELDGILEHLL